MPTSTMSTKGQIVLPKEVRDFLELRPGDRVDFVVRDNGEVVIRPAVVDVRELKGILRRPGRRPVSLDEMKAAIKKRGGGAS
jgi:antitoxin PrlF